MFLFYRLLALLTLVCLLVPPACISYQHFPFRNQSMMKHKNTAGYSVKEIHTRSLPMIKVESSTGRNSSSPTYLQSSHLLLSSDTLEEKYIANIFSRLAEKSILLNISGVCCDSKFILVVLLYFCC